MKNSSFAIIAALVFLVELMVCHVAAGVKYIIKVGMIKCQNK